MRTVCVDLDGVLAQYDGWKGVTNIGDPVPGAREFMEGLKTFSKVVVHTTRTNSDVNLELDQAGLVATVEGWLDKHEIPFDAVAFGGKPLAVAYVDDRAVLCRPQKDVENQDFDTALRMCRALASGHELGSQGTYSEGKLNEEDEGDLKMMVSHSDGIVRVDFGKPVGWLGLPKSQAMEFATLIYKHAREL